MKLLTVLSLSLFLLVVLDTVTTVYALTRHPNIKELNPIYYALPITLNIFIKIALTVLLILLMEYITEIFSPNLDVQTFINILALILVLMYTCAVINNFIVILIS